MVEFGHRGVAGMHVGVYQAGQDHLAIEIEQLRILGLETQHLLLPPDGDNPAALDGHSLADRERGIDRDDPGVVDDQLRPGRVQGRRQTQQNHARISHDRLLDAGDTIPWFRAISKGRGPSDSSGAT
jgi:hypothetical protein